MAQEGGKINLNIDLNQLIEIATNLRSISDSIDIVLANAGVKKTRKRKRSITEKKDKKKKKTPNCYNLYLMENFEAYKQQGSTLQFAEISKIVADKWREMGDDAKKPYREKAKLAKEEFDKDALDDVETHETGELQQHTTQSLPVVTSESEEEETETKILPPASSESEEETEEESEEEPKPKKRKKDSHSKSKLDKKEKKKRNKHKKDKKRKKRHSHSSD